MSLKPMRVGSSTEWDSIIAGSEPQFGMLGSRYFTDFDSTLEYSILIDEAEIPQFLLPLQRVGNVLVSHPELPWAGLIPLRRIESNLEWLPGALSQILSVGVDPAIDSVRVKCKPPSACGGWDEARIWGQVGIIQGDAATYSIDLHSGSEWSGRRVRGLKQAEKQGVRVDECSSAENVNEVWQKVQAFYQERDLPEPLPTTRIGHLLENGFAKLFVAKAPGEHTDEERIVGAALVYQLGSALRVPTYVAFDRDYKGVTEALIRNTQSFAAERRLTYLDLGRSVDPTSGELVEGIAQFKMECGAKPEPTCEAVISSN